MQSLLAADLVNKLRLLILRILLGTGRRLFGEGTRPVAFRLTRAVAPPSGALIATYERDGDVRTGTFVRDTSPEKEPPAAT